ncbi:MULTISPECIES: type I-E CRISPR-associated protein Cas7/Cse4/CasC [unclassified Aurantimonas]|uniref:type I-E CRISPR-associated protein Cas7/Cse4/CasC n=1 Tax=unclassified Aurantimonas TaxID=2638230 RepID=UPI002E17157F|nr:MULTISPECIES: type I-E CRISPR-associated protein Cas7/Cse4/CasC [unclassified Aurantimonas]MEC5293082.1 type I-E CRISPR-associated protein Cas7/Cse4/CasC [Aurantimonas sp. C2-3-R2]MEC5414122.1 type I-E CRISPR-associated protein Cas7/Cse4/CasC [Aurantimonas sp. C2-4-R8]
MTTPRFLQIHTLHSYTAALLNRDDTGLSKRLPYGDAVRTRISSQCLKRHWRIADDPHALDRIDGAALSFRSRQLVSEMVIEPLKSRYPDEIVAALEPEFQKAVYGDKGDKGKQSRQTLLFGAPELAFLADEAEKLAAASATAAAAQAAVSEWTKSFKANIKALREATALPGGLTSALFGRMVTSDPEANIDAPVHVAHAFTVHPEQAEGDYFTAVDDLAKEGDSGADTIQETELTSGLFYGYVVVDMRGLIDNCGKDRALAAKVLHNLVYLIAEISPGAKLGSTAPYGRAELMLLEAGDRQPRSLAGAYREAQKNSLMVAANALAKHLSDIDGIYATGEVRRYFSLANETLPDASPGTLKQLAEWAAEQLEGVE